MSVLNFEDQDAVGTVTSVDTATVTVSVSDDARLRSLQVNHLVALRSSRAGQHLIGLITKITRRGVDTSIDDTTKPETEIRTIENLVRVNLIGTFIDVHGTQRNIFRRTLETVPEIDARCFVLEGAHLTEFMQTISKPTSGTNSPLQIGTYTIDDSAHAWLDGNRFFQRHAVIVGSTGSGKSWCVANLLLQIAQLKAANAILFDIHGEYEPLSGQDISYYRIAGPADIAKNHGLDQNVIRLPHWLLTYEEMLALLLDRSDQNAPNQAMLFSSAVTDAKSAALTNAKMTQVLANFTIDSPVPYPLEDVLRDLRDKDTEMVGGARGEKQGPYFGKLSRFIQRLEAKRADRRLGFLFSENAETVDYSWMAKLCTILLDQRSSANGGGVKIIDFSEVPSDILPLITGLIARIVFTVQQWMAPNERHPVALFCDEAHLYIVDRTTQTGAEALGLSAFERVAKEGRKYGLGLVVISQRPSEVNKTVLSQCNNFVALRLSNVEDQAVVRRLLPDSLGNFAELLPVLDVGEALVVGDASILPSRVRVQPPSRKPNSGTVAFWDEWCQNTNTQDIPAAVESVRRQSKQ